MDVFRSLVALVLAALLMFGVVGFVRSENQKQEVWKKMKVILVTRQGIPVSYHGHKILYLKGTMEEDYSNLSIVLSVDGRRIEIAPPGVQLNPLHDEKGWGFSSCLDDRDLSRFAFYLPDGEKLRLKALSSDLLDLHWAKES